LHPARHTRVQAWHARIVSLIDLHLLASILPHVRNPWPGSIGLGFPFTLAGAGDMAVEVLLAGEPADQRDHVARRAGVRCFRAGVAIYALALLDQLTLGL
jgi:hypothetical protein